MSLAETEKLLTYQKQLQAIVWEGTLNAEDRIKNILKLLGDFIDDGTAILSEIKADQYHVKYISGPNFGLEEGTSRKLGSTVCARTFEVSRASNQPVILDFLRDKKELKGIPIPKGAKGYIGQEIKIDGRSFGTLCVFSQVSLTEDHTAVIDFFQQVKMALCYELERSNLYLEIQNASSRRKDILDNMPVAALQFDLDLNCIDCNKTWQQLSGFSKQKSLGKDWKNAFHPDDLKSLLDDWQSILKKKGTLKTESRILPKDNRAMAFVEFRAVALYSSTGDPDGYIVSLSDTTEINKVKADLEISESFFKSIVNTAEEGIWVIDTEGKTTYTNEKMSSMLGYAQEEMAGKALFDFMDEQGQKMAKAKLEKRKKGEAESHDFKFLTKQGSEIWASINTNPIIDKNGKVESVLGMLSDITGRKENEIKIQNLNQVLSSIKEAQKQLLEEQFSSKDIFNPILDALLSISESRGCSIHLHDKSKAKGQQEAVYKWSGDVRKKAEKLNLTSLLDYAAEEALKRGDNCYLKSDESDFKPPYITASGNNSAALSIYFEHTGSKVVLISLVGWDLNVDKALFKELEPLFDSINQFINTYDNLLKKAEVEAKLKNRDEQLRNIISNIPGVVYRANPDWSLDYINNSHLFNGFSDDGLLSGKFKWEEIVLPEDLQRIREESEQAGFYYKDTQIVHEYRIINASKEIFWCRDMKRSVVKNGELVAIDGILFDITEEKLANERLRESESTHRSLLESQSNYLVRIDKDGYYEYMNKKFREDYGYEETDLKTEQVFALSSICEYHHQRTIDTVSQCYAHPGEIVTVELDKPSRFGVMTCLWEFTAIKDDSGLPGSVQSIGINITDIKKATEKLEMERQKYFDVFDNMTIGVIIQDANLKVTFANRASSQIFGIPTDQLNTYYPKNPDFDKHRVIDENGRFLKYDELPYVLALSKKKAIRKVVGLIKGDQTIWVNVNAVPRLIEGNQYEVYSTLEDITELHEQRQLILQKNQLMDAVINSVPSSIFVVDKSGKLVEINDKALDYIDLKDKETALGKSILEIYPNQHFTNLMQKSVKGVFKYKKPLRWEGDSTVKPGEIHEHYRLPIMNADGEVDYVLGVVHDITERKRQAEKMNNLVRDSLAGVFIKHWGGSFIEVNDAFAEILGYRSSKDILKKGILMKDFYVSKSERETLDNLLSKHGAVKNHMVRLNDRYNQTKIALVNAVMRRIGEDVIVEGTLIDVTDREQTQTKLENERARLLSLFTNLTIGIIIQNDEAEIIFTNPAACHILGLTEDQMMGRTSRNPEWRTIKEDGSDFPGEEHPAVVALRDHKIVQNNIMGVHTPEGELKWLRVSAVPVRQENGRLEVYVTFEDHTITYEQSKEINNQRSILNTILNNVPLNIYLLDKEYRCIQANSKMLETLNKNSHEIIGKDFTSLFDIDQQKITDYHKSIDQVFKTKKAISFQESSFIDEEHIYEHARVPVFDDDGKVVSVLGTSLDITDRVLQEGRMNNLVNNSLAGIFMIRLDGSFLEANNAFKDLLHLELLADKYTGKDGPNFWSLISDEMRMEKWRNLILKNGYISNSECRFKRGDGAEIRVLVSAVLQEYGSNQYIEGILIDITEKSEFQEALEKTTEELRNSEQSILRMADSLKLYNEKLEVALHTGNFLAWEVTLNKKGKRKLTIVPENKERSFFERITNFKSVDDFGEALFGNQNQSFENLIERHLNGYSEYIEMECKVESHSESEWRWYYLKGKVIQMDNEGNPISVFGIIQNIDWKKRGEILLYQSQEKERVRVSREVHDSVGQMLVGARFLMNQSLKNKSNIEGEYIKLKTRDVEDVDQMLDDIIKETRIIINNLGVSVFENRTIESALQNLINKMRKVSNAQIHLEVINPQWFEDTIMAANCFRIVQEALSNAMKYAEADHIYITLGGSEEAFIVVEDDGRGFDVEEVSKGFGIGNMRERANVIQAQLRVSSQKGKGTKMVVCYDKEGSILDKS